MAIKNLSKKAMLSLMAALMATTMMMGTAKADGGDKDFRLRVDIDKDIDGLSLGHGFLGNRMGFFGHGLSGFGLGGFPSFGSFGGFGSLDDRSVNISRNFSENKSSIPSGFSITRMPMMDGMMVE